MPNVFGQIKNQPSMLLPLLPLLAFIIPLIGLYLFNPIEPFLGITSDYSAQETFESMWKGRTFELFFVWLIGLELILGWENFKETKLTKLASPRAIALIVALIIPTFYVVAAYVLGLNDAIVNWSLANNIQGGWATTMPVSMEYLAFAACFTAIAFLMFGKKGLINYALPAFFMVAVGAIYVIDNMYPYGQFTLFQFFVPTAAATASAVFNLMGYTTVLTEQTDLVHGTMPILTVSGPAGSTQFGIAWPCAGIESFLIYTVVVLLFLKRMPFSWKAKIGFFTLGAVVTYFINIFRIVNIFMIGMQYGAASPEVDLFHSYYGPLYSITWIVAYPLLLFLAQSLWSRYRSNKYTKASVPKNSLPVKLVRLRQRLLLSLA
ncbi:MAG: exosortase/archaeosortase family protein [Candidatus Bathyarchaeia archaeon]|jgi:exosortase/archaeosortase family protein